GCRRIGPGGSTGRHDHRTAGGRGCLQEIATTAFARPIVRSAVHRDRLSSGCGFAPRLRWGGMSFLIVAITKAMVNKVWTNLKRYPKRDLSGPSVTSGAGSGPPDVSQRHHWDGSGGRSMDTGKGGKSSGAGDVPPEGVRDGGAPACGLTGNAEGAI